MDDTCRENERDHTIPLNKQAIKIIEIMKPISGGVNMFSQH